MRKFLSARPLAPTEVSRRGARSGPAPVGCVALAALLAACDDPERAIVRPDAGPAGDAPTADAPSSDDVSPERVGAPSAGDCAQDRGGCSVYARCAPAGEGMRRCVCAAGLRVQSDQRACEGLLLVSVARDGRAAGVTVAARLAAGGRYVVFVSQAPDLPSDRAVPATTPAPPRCYVRDVVTGRTALLSADATGALPGALPGCFAPQVSGDGRLVAFLTADAITPDDPSPYPVSNVYVRALSADLTVGPPRRLHFDAVGRFDQDSNAMHMSRDGRRFALATRSALVAGDDGELDVYVYTEGATPRAEPASVDNAGRLPPWGGACGGNVRPSAFSGDGDFIGFDSVRRYVAGDDDEVLDPHVRSLTSRRTELLTVRRDSLAPPRRTCAYMGSGLALSYDASVVLFYSDNARLDDTLTPGNPDAFLRVRDTAATSHVVRLHVDPFPDPGGQLNEGVALSDDGRYAVVPSLRRLDLPPGAALHPAPDLYLLDLSDPSDPLRGARILDVDARGEPSDSTGVLFEPTIAADGSAVAFTARTPLVPEDTNALPDVYLRVLR